MSRYIDYNAIDYRNDKMHGKSSDFIDGVIYMAQRIEEAPSIDLADYVPKDFHDKTCEAMAKMHTEEIQRLMPKRGEWKLFYESKDGDNVFKCSCCRLITVIPEGIKLFSFCPNCGADMRGKGDE